MVNKVNLTISSDWSIYSITLGGIDQDYVNNNGELEITLTGNGLLLVTTQNSVTIGEENEPDDSTDEDSEEEGPVALFSLSSNQQIIITVGVFAALSIIIVLVWRFAK